MSDTHPEFVKALLKTEAYSWNPKKIDLLETSTSYLFQADNLIYKIKKKSKEFSTLAVKEAFCHEEFKL